MEKNIKINSTTVIEHYKKEEAHAAQNLPLETGICSILEFINILPPILLKELPAERVSGFINLHYVFRGGGSKKDVEDALVSI